MKFQVCSHLLLHYSPVCVGPGQKPDQKSQYDYNVVEFEVKPNLKQKCFRSGQNFINCEAPIASLFEYNLLGNPKDKYS